MEKELTYLFGRLNLIASFTSFSEKEDYLWNSLRAKIYINDGINNWGILDLNKHEFNSESFFTGKLSKYTPDAEEKQADTLNKQIKTVGIKDKIIASAAFVLHVRSGLIAYHVISNKISRNQFCKKFSEIIMKANDYLLVDAEIQSLNNQRSFLSEIRTFDTVNKISIYLHPSNPKFAKYWEKTDKKIKDIGAEKYTASYSNNSPNGLKINDELNDTNSNTVNPVTSEIYMAEDGYGIARATGSKNGKKKTISTRNTPITITLPENFEGEILIRNLSGQFNIILDRVSYYDTDKLESPKK